MRYKTLAIPKPSLGADFSKEKNIVVPDQSMTLEEILSRFTRDEALPVGQQIEYGDEDMENPLNVDLEKMALADLVDKAEYAESLSEVVKNFEKQEKQKAAAEKKAQDDAFKIADDERVRLAAEKLAKENLAR